MNGSLVRVLLLGFMTIASALGVWAIHVSVARAIGPIGGVLAAIVASMMLGSLVWIGAVAGPVPRGRGDGETASGRSDPRTR